jgi:hypothetical protein
MVHMTRRLFQVALALGFGAGGGLSVSAASAQGSAPPEVQALVSAAARAFNQTLVTGHSDQALQGEPLADAVRQGMQGELTKAAAANAAAARGNIRYTRADAEVSITEATIEGDRGTVKAAVNNTRAMSGPAGTPAQSRVTEYHVFEIARQNGRWVITGDQMVLPWQPPYGNPVEVDSARRTLPPGAVPMQEGAPSRGPIDRTKPAGTASALTAPGRFAAFSGGLRAPARPAAFGSYSTSPALAYMRQWLWGYNPDYRKFAGVGGDCTNFVSQVLRAGGWADVSGFYTSDSAWWYNWTNQSYTWAGAQNLYNYINQSGRATFAASTRDMLAGDIVQFRLGDYLPDAIHHSAVVDASDGLGNIWISYHSGPAEHELLSTFLTKHGPGTYTYGWLLYYSY